MKHIAKAVLIAGITALLVASVFGEDQKSLSKEQALELENYALKAKLIQASADQLQEQFTKNQAQNRELVTTICKAVDATPEQCDLDIAAKTVRKRPAPPVTQAPSPAKK